MLKQKKTPIINEMEDAKKELDSLILHQIERYHQIMVQFLGSIIDFTVQK